jgi:hypothetical protein
MQWHSLRWPSWAKGADSFRRILLLTATAVAVLTATVLSFGLRLGSRNTGLEGGVTQVESIGLALVLLTIVPVIVAVLPLILPMRMRARLVLTGAIGGTVLSVLASPFLGALYLPLVFLLWAAVIVPWLRYRGNGRGTQVAWRIAFSIAMVVPPAFYGANLMWHSYEVTWATWAGVLLSLLLVALAAAGVRAGYLVAAALGGGMMIYAVVTYGMLFNETWLVGGLYLAIGLSAIVSTTRK